MLDPIIPIHHTTHQQEGFASTGPTISFHPDPGSPDDILGSSPSIKFTASPEPRFTQLKTFPTEPELEEKPQDWESWLWYKTELFLCAFTVYGELCCAARSLDALSEYSKLHHGSSSPSPSFFDSTTALGGDELEQQAIQLVLVPPKLGVFLGYSCRRGCQEWCIPGYIIVGKSVW